jgi:nucleoside-diphosphate kinase
MSKERTLVLVKPDGVRRHLTGEIISRIERKGYDIVELKQLSATREILEQHYAEHEGKPFYEPLVEFMLSGPVVALVASAPWRAPPSPPPPPPAPSAVTWDATGA